MDKSKEVLVIIAAMLSSLRGDSVPSGTMYAAFMTKGITFEQYTDLVGVLISNGLIKQSNNLLSLTPKGEAMAMRIDSVMSAG